MWTAEFCLCEDHNGLWLTANRKFAERHRSSKTYLQTHTDLSTSIVQNGTLGIEHTLFPKLLTHNENNLTMSTLYKKSLLMMSRV